MATQKAVWGGLELLERPGDLLLEDGSRDCLDEELAQAIQASLGPLRGRGPHFDQLGDDPHLVAVLNEILRDLGLVSLDDLQGEPLEFLLEGIFDS